MEARSLITGAVFGALLATVLFMASITMIEGTPIKHATIGGTEVPAKLSCTQHEVIAFSSEREWDSKLPWQPKCIPRVDPTIGNHAVPSIHCTEDEVIAFSKEFRTASISMPYKLGCVHIDTIRAE